ncbi:hypothetical protein MLD38_018293 [Melastoma candidum]|uniref:Uncharacterized protein n=1 Tax=Melastoma candidum TaxID=119954 RepID=A0ACB9QTA9_9MYRT|nr:hypothetical protein MLD38_018293 [Melastoma candidum]
MMFSSGVTLNTCHDVEIGVISAEQLTINGRPIKNKAFATVVAGGCPNLKSYSTRIDEEGGHCPCWNEKFLVNLASTSRYILVEVHRRGSSGDKIVGRAWIPVSDFSDEYSVPVANRLHFLSYRLRDTKGLKNGIVNVSIRVLSPTETSPCSSSSSPVFYSGSRPGMVTGFPVQLHAGTAVNQEEFGSRA